MPERPDLEYAIPILAKTLVGRTIRGVRLHKPVVLRHAIDLPLNEALVGQRFDAVSRRGHFYHFALTGTPPLSLIVAPMLAGCFVVCEAATKRSKDVALTWELGDHLELRYHDNAQMGKVYVVGHNQWQHIPGFESIGTDVLSEDFTLAGFRALAAKRRDQVKVFLLDKSALDSLGNAYADEVLHHAGIHPKTFTHRLTPEELERLYVAIQEVLRTAQAEIARRKPATNEKVRDFLKVRNRHGQPCPTCGTTIRKTGVYGHDAFFCPACQPETRKSGLVDWRKR